MGSALPEILDTGPAFELERVMLTFSTEDQEGGTDSLPGAEEAGIQRAASL